MKYSLSTDLVTISIPAGKSSNLGLNKAEVINLIKLAEKHVCCSIEVTKASRRSGAFTMASKALTVASNIGLDGVLLPRNRNRL